MSILSTIGIEGGELLLKALAVALPPPLGAIAAAVGSALPDIPPAVQDARKLWEDVHPYIMRGEPLTADHADRALAIWSAAQTLGYQGQTGPTE